MIQGSLPHFFVMNGVGHLVSKLDYSEEGRENAFVTIIAIRILTRIDLWQSSVGEADDSG